MKRAKTLLLAATFTLTFSSLVAAHHSGSAYQSNPLWLQGTVVAFEPSNPHTITTLETQRNDGRIQRWRVEGPPMTQLGRTGTDRYLPQVGDELRFCAFPYKPIDELQRLWPDVDYSTRPVFRIQETEDAVTQTVTGHIMLTPAGAKQFWEPHGILAECVRTSDDTHESWLGLIGSVRRQVWCPQRQYAVVQQDPTLAAFVEEINALLDEPCE